MACGSGVHASGLSCRSLSGSSPRVTASYFPHRVSVRGLGLGCSRDHDHAGDQGDEAGDTQCGDRSNGEGVDDRGVLRRRQGERLRNGAWDRMVALEADGQGLSEAGRQDGADDGDAQGAAQLPGRGLQPARRRRPAWQAAPP